MQQIHGSQSLSPQLSLTKFGAIKIFSLKDSQITIPVNMKLARFPYRFFDSRRQIHTVNNFNLNQKAVAGFINLGLPEEIFKKTFFGFREQHQFAWVWLKPNGRCFM